jgi:hypothetical protein
MMTMGKMLITAGICGGLMGYLMANAVGYYIATIFWSGWDCYYLLNQHESWEQLSTWLWGRSLAFEHMINEARCN